MPVFEMSNHMYPQEDQTSPSGRAMEDIQLDYESVNEKNPIQTNSLFTDLLVADADEERD